MGSLKNNYKRIKFQNSVNEKDFVIESNKDFSQLIYNNDILSKKNLIKFDSLDDVVLKRLFAMLSVSEMLSMERVCKRWQNIIIELLKKQTALGTCWLDDEENNCLEWRSKHCVIGGDIRKALVMNNDWFYDLTDQNSLKRLTYISKKCPNIMCLHINHSIISAKCLMRLFELMPKIECIYLRNNKLKVIGPCYEDNNKKSPCEWNNIGKVLGHKIRHLYLNPHYEHRMNEVDTQLFLQHFNKLEEFRMGTNFGRDVKGYFVGFLPKTLNLFYSLGRELSNEAFDYLINEYSQNFTHFTFYSHPRDTVDYLTKIGNKLLNLIRLRINLSFNDKILSTSSPISKLKHLQELSLDLNTFIENFVDESVIWCLKDGLPSLHTLEITRTCLSPKSFNAIQFCVPQIKKLILLCVEIQCFCYSVEVLERHERYCCSICRLNAWHSLSNINQLRELHILNPYYRQEKPKQFQSELCEVLPEFKNLNILNVFRYDISGVDLFQALDRLLNKQSDDGVSIIFTLTLRSIYCDLENKIINKKLRIVYDPWML